MDNVEKELSKDLQEICDKLFVSIKQKVDSIGISINTIQKIIVIVMEEIEQTPIKGSTQKLLALRLIKLIIDTLPDSNNEKVYLLDMYKNNIISNTIDIVVSATKGEININQITSCLFNCSKFCKNICK